jgi:integrase
MARPTSRLLEKTKHPGIYKRGGRYVVIYRDTEGKSRKRAAETLAQARDIKAAVHTDISRGEYVPQTTLTLKAYYDEWIESYIGRTRNGIRPATITGYKDQMRVHVLPELGRRRLSQIGPRDVKALAATLTAKGLSPNSVRLAIAPLKALLADAFEEELIRRNPAANVRLAQPKTSETEDEQAKVKALTADELNLLIGKLPKQHRLVVEVLARTGLRIGELAALRWSDVDFGRQRILVRRRWYRGTFAPPKSKYGSRDVPISKTLGRRLWSVRGRDDELIFGTKNGTPMAITNYYNRVYKPAAVKAGVPWATLHTLRHTCATDLFRAGKNAKQVQEWLGHHSASFTLDTYIHLLEDDIGEAPAGFDAPLNGATKGQPDTPNSAETSEAVPTVFPLSEAVSAVPA